MTAAPLGIAFAAGLVATVNPCGFAMLPAYLSYFMGIDGADDDATSGSSVAQALKVGGIVSLGFLTVFGTTGLLINAGLRSIIEWIPYVALGIGAVMILLGVAIFRGYELSIGFFKVEGGTSSREKKSVFTFGVTYAIASLSCTLPVFLSVVVGSIAATSFVAGFATYIAYGVGMSIVLVSLTLAMAVAKQGLVKRLRSMLPYVQRISAVFLVVAGVYITWLWFAELSSDAGAQGEAAGVVDGWSASITNWIGDRSGSIGLVLGGLVVIAVLSSFLKRFEPPAPVHQLDRHDEHTQHHADKTGELR